MNYLDDFGIKEILSGEMKLISGGSWLTDLTDAVEVAIYKFVDGWNSNECGSEQNNYKQII